MDKSCDTCIYSGQPITSAVCVSCGMERNNYMPKTDKYTTMTVEEFEYAEGFGGKEEVNHPTRYNSNKYECIDVMVDVFGEEETAAFCKLNAFKYIWREKRKGGVEDIDKAIWYLNKYKELIE